MNGHDTHQKRVLNEGQTSKIKRGAMSMQISVELLNGEMLDLEVTPETTMREVKRRIKETQTWEDDVSRDTTVVELIIGDKKVPNDETVEEVGLSEGSKLAAVFRLNMAQCSSSSGFGPDLDPEALTIVKVPDSEIQIIDRAFWGCRRLAKVTIPSSVTRIGHGAFSGCASLVSVNIPDSVTWISPGAFAGCSALTEVSLPDSITHIGNNAFNGCSSLIEVTIPDSVTQIEAGAFNHCSGLTLTAPARLLNPGLGRDIKQVAKECG